MLAIALILSEVSVLREAFWVWAESGWAEVSRRAAGGADGRARAGKGKRCKYQ